MGDGVWYLGLLVCFPARYKTFIFPDFFGLPCFFGGSLSGYQITFIAEVEIFQTVCFSFVGYKSGCHVVAAFLRPYQNTIHDILC